MRNKYIKPEDTFGIRSFIARTLAITPKKMFIGKAAFKLLIFSAPLGKVPFISKIYKKLILMSKSDYSQGYSIPLNIDIGNRIEKDIIPKDLMKKAVENSSFRAIMHECICREAQGCENYPKDLGCLFLGEAAKVCVKNGIASIATIDECFDHIERAASFGLSGQVLWVEVEKYIWGFETKNADKFLEFCFCCPCCCTGFKFADRTSRDARLLFHRSSGWIAAIKEEKCRKCMKCSDICPRHAIEITDGYPFVNKDCGGCGLCVSTCKDNAISLIQIDEMKNNIQEYFEDIDFKIWKNK